MSHITCEAFGHLADGQSVERYTLTGVGGLEVAILTYGATVQAIRFDGVDVVLGYDTLEGYLNGSSCQGASIGRYGNRIAAGRFVLNGETYTLNCNENGTGHLHGGNVGFDRRLWKAEPLMTEDPALRLSLVSPDGEEGYPGTLSTSVTYSVTPDNALHILYAATSDRDTHYNPTNHAYFNLSGANGTDALGLELQIQADHYTPVDAHLIPTGELCPVEGTPFDFRTPKTVGRDILAEDAQLAIVGQGYDHNLVLNGTQPFATLYAPSTDIEMACFTDQPGVQLYSATCLGEPGGKNGEPLRRFQAVCLETQHYPDSPNKPAFPSTLLKAGERYHSETIYRFAKRH